MSTQQPKWKCIAQLGDASPLEYGGFWVFEDTTGVYAPEAEHYDPDSGMVSRIVLEPHTYRDGILSDNPYHPDYPVWYADDIGSIAESVGHDGPLPIIDALCSDNAISRALAYREIAGYFGWHEFRAYPLTLTHAEARARYSSANYAV